MMFLFFRDNRNGIESPSSEPDVPQRLETVELSSESNAVVDEEDTNDADQSVANSPEPTHDDTLSQVSIEGTTRPKDDILQKEIQRIVSIEPGKEFVETKLDLPLCRFYRPGLLLALCCVCMSVVIIIFAYSKSTGIHKTICAGLPRGTLLVLTWGIIGFAIGMGVVGCLFIFWMPPSSLAMNWVLRRIPTDQCQLSEEQKKSIIPDCHDNQFLHLRLAGSAGDGFGCFFGQNGNIGLTKVSDFCQDLDLNIVYDAKAGTEYSFQKINPGFVNVSLVDKDCVLSNLTISNRPAEGTVPEGENTQCLISGSKVMESMKSVLDNEINSTRIFTTPPAQRIEKEVTIRGKKQPIQYDYVFSLMAHDWPEEASDVSMLQMGGDNIKVCYVVPKPWADAKEDENEKIWRYSFTEAEAKLFQAFSRYHKALIKCYIILKFIIKFDNVSRFPFRKCLCCCCCKIKDESEPPALKSYFLKTIFLHISRELESRRLAEEQLRCDDRVQEVGIDLEDEDYQIYCDPEELLTTLSGTISPPNEDHDKHRGVQDVNFSIGTEDSVVYSSGGDTIELNPVVIASSLSQPKRILKKVLSLSGSADSSRRSRNRTLMHDDILLLILQLYMVAMERRTLMHFFVKDLNLLQGFSKELCDKGKKTLRKIKAARLVRILDFQDFWGSRSLLHVSYIITMVCMVTLVILVCIIIYGSVWLMRRDTSKDVCPI